MKSKNFLIILASSLFIITISLFIIKSPKTKNSSPSLVKKGGLIIYHGNRDKKQVALTFDADMTTKMKRELESGTVKSWYNQKIIEILKKEHVSATLFLSGLWIESYPAETKELSQNPLFELANHSYSHPAFQKNCYALKLIPDSADEEEVLKTQKLLKEVAGVENNLFRYPGGCHEKSDDKIVTSLGLNIIFWDASSGDSFNKNKASLLKNIKTYVQNGSIILMHLNGNANAPYTSEALPEIIQYLKSRDFEFVKISQMLED